MIKKGDTVVCVLNINKLTVGKNYKVLDDDYYNHYIIVMNDNDIADAYNIKHFKSLSDIREDKLKSLLNE